MKYLFLLIVVYSYVGCCNKDCCDPPPNTLPVCLQKYVSDSLNLGSLKSIKLNELDGSEFYLLNTDAPLFDGIDFIVNDHCDTVCWIGGMRIPLECADKLNSGSWVVIWQR